MRSSTRQTTRLNSDKKVNSKPSEMGRSPLTPLANRPLILRSSAYLESYSFSYSECFFAPFCFGRRFFTPSFFITAKPFFSPFRLIAQGCTCANCPSVHTERWFDTQSVWLFENSLIHPSPQRKTALISADFHGGEGWIRTTEVTDNRFTVCSLWPLGNLSVWSW